MLLRRTEQRDFSASLASCMTSCWNSVMWWYRNRYRDTSSTKLKNSHFSINLEWFSIAILQVCSSPYLTPWRDFLDRVVLSDGQDSTVHELFQPWRTVWAPGESCVNWVLQKRLLQLIHDNMRQLEQRCSTNPPHPGSAVEPLNFKTKVGFPPYFFFFF